MEAGSDECLEDLGFGRLRVSYSTVSGVSWEPQNPGTQAPGWVRLNKLARARVQGLESLEVGSDECVEDPGSGGSE